MPLMKSWVSTANAPDHPFPLNNLPYGVFSTADLDPRCGVAIGDMILDMQSAEETGLIALGDLPLFDVPFWNEVMEAGPQIWAALRDRLTALLAEDSPERASVEPLLVQMDAAEMHLPFIVSEYTDFYAGRHHATNVGTMFRGPENALPPNWLHIPIGYNGRASSVVVSGTPVRRPWGQLKSPDHARPAFLPCRRFDIELEMGAIVGTPSDGPITVAEADANIFGYVLLNDWSARDIQAWEYQPLGPFQAKATATTISPWIVTAAALAPFRVPIYPDAQSAVRDWVAKLGLNAPIQTFALLDRMNHAIVNNFRYLIREEPGVQNPAQTLGLNSGSCRDFAALFIEACRHLGLAARFVSGYLYTADTDTGNASTHAWAEVYLPGAGWKGFDPTSGEVAGNRHIATAVARHPEAVPPVAGSFFGPPGLSPEMRVEVRVSTLLPEAR